jgi:hypothetical protein
MLSLVVQVAQRSPDEARREYGSGYQGRYCSEKKSRALWRPFDGQCVRSGDKLASALARCLRVEERRAGMFRDDYASKCDRVSSQEMVVMNFGP